MATASKSRPFRVPTYQPKPRLHDSSVAELQRCYVTGGEPCVSFMAEMSPGGNAVEIVITSRELHRLARWCNWEPKKAERVTWPDL